MGTRPSNRPATLFRESASLKRAATCRRWQKEWPYLIRKETGACELLWIMTVERVVCRGIVWTCWWMWSVVDEWWRPVFECCPFPPYFIVSISRFSLDFPFYLFDDAGTMTKEELLRRSMPNLNNPAMRGRLPHPSAGLASNLNRLHGSDSGLRPPSIPSGHVPVGTPVNGSQPRPQLRPPQTASLLHRESAGSSTLSSASGSSGSSDSKRQSLVRCRKLMACEATSNKYLRVGNAAVTFLWLSSNDCQVWDCNRLLEIACHPPICQSWSNPS